MNLILAVSVQKLKDKGLKITEISKALNIPRSTVYRYLKNLDKIQEHINLRYKIFRIKEEFPHLTIDEISKRVGLSKIRVYRILKDYGLVGFNKREFCISYYFYCYTKKSTEFLKLGKLELVGCVKSLKILKKYKYEALPLHLKLNKITLDLDKTYDSQKALKELKNLIPKLKKEKLNYSLLRALVIYSMLSFQLYLKDEMIWAYRQMKEIKHRDLCIKLYELFCEILLSENYENSIKKAYKLLKKLEFPKYITSEFLVVCFSRGYYKINININKYAEPMTAIFYKINNNNYDYQKEKEFINKHPNLT
jgi:predicted transcriptional regulator